MEPKYKRIMIKLSGEAMAGDAGFGLDHKKINSIAEQIKRCYDMGVEIGIVIGGGNFWRGRDGEGMDRSRACLLYTSIKRRAAFSVPARALSSRRNPE